MAELFLLNAVVFCLCLIGQESQSTSLQDSPKGKVSKEERKALQKEMYELAKDPSDVAFSQIAEYAVNDDPILRRMVAVALVRSNHEEAFGLLLSLLNDESKSVRGSAALSLGYKKDERAYEPLLDVLEKDQSSYVRGMAVYALGQLRTEKSLGKVIACLTSNLTTVRVNAASVLGRSEDKRAIESLVLALNDPEDKVREKAAKSLNALTGQEELYNKTQNMSTDEAYQAWQKWWRENKDTFKVIKRSLRYSRSAKEWLERYDTDGNGALNEKELQAALDDLFMREPTQR